MGINVGIDVGIEVGFDVFVSINIGKSVSTLLVRFIVLEIVGIIVVWNVQEI